MATAPGSLPTTQSRSNGLAIGALVVGILAVPTALFVFGGVLGLVAIILGFLGLKKSKELANAGRGMSISGIVMGVLSILLAIAVATVGVAALNFLESPEGQEVLESLSEQIETST